MATRYWVGGSGTWDASTTTNWASSTGGLGGASAPISTDDVIFDSASGTGTVVCSSAVCQDLTMSALSQSIVFSLGGTLPIISYGNIVGSPFVSFTGTGAFTTYPIAGRGNLTSNGMAFSVLNANINPSTVQTFSLQDDLVATGNIRIGRNTDGIFNTNNHNVTCTKNLRIEGTLNLGSSTLQVTAALGHSVGVYALEVYYATINAGTSTIKVVAGGASGSWGRMNFDNNYTFYNFIIDGTGGGTLKFSNPYNVTFSQLKVINPPVTVQFYSAQTYTVGHLSAEGLKGNYITFQAVDSGSQTLFNVTSSSVFYVDVKDNDASGGINIIDRGGINSLNNINWSFPSNNLYLQNTLMVGAETSEVQTLNAGKDDDGTPIYYELETQGLEFGNVFHRKKISDKIVVFAKDGIDSNLQGNSDDGNYEDIKVDLSNRVNIGQKINLEGNTIKLKWFGTANESSPILEGFYLESVSDLGTTKG